jgi:TolB protein
VFSSRRGEGDYEVYVMNADGTDKRRLTHDTVESENPAWSPDGTRFVYTLDDYAGGSDIYLRNADGSGKRRLTRTGNAAGGAWSPDGAHIAIHRNTQGGSSDLFLLAVPDLAGVGGGGAHRLTDLGNLGVMSPSWSPDGRLIVCVVDTNPDPKSWELSLYVLDVEDALLTGGSTLPEMRPLPCVGDSLNDWPAWSPTGAQIAFSAVVGGHRDIYVVNVDGTGLQQVTQTPKTDEFAPAWSPDGTHIVFQANPDGQWDIYRMRADGSDRRQLTTDPANDTAPSWAP